MVTWLKLGAIAGLILILVLSLVNIPSSASSGCNPAYPTVCIPSPPPNLDCKDIPHRHFRVVSPDPHQLDRDKDGIGCERNK